MSEQSQQTFDAIDICIISTLHHCRRLLTRGCCRCLLLCTLLLPFGLAFKLVFADGVEQIKYRRGNTGRRLHAILKPVVRAARTTAKSHCRLLLESSSFCLRYSLAPEKQNVGERAFLYNPALDRC